MINIILFGPPGAGKGTQSEKLIEKYGFVHLSTGDIFRKNIGAATELGQLAKSYMDKGQLVPDSVTISMLEAEVLKNINAKGIIFDGFPRNTTQANALDEFLKGNGKSITKMIALEVDESELRHRLLERGKTSGRPDDVDPVIIQKRIDVYNNETAPVKEHYLRQNKYAGIFGIGNIDSIFDLICRVIDGVNPITATKADEKIVEIKKTEEKPKVLPIKPIKVKIKTPVLKAKKSAPEKNKVAKKKNTKVARPKIKKAAKKITKPKTKKSVKIKKSAKKRGRPTLPKKRGRPEIKKRGRPTLPKRRGRPEIKKRGRPTLPKKRGRPEIKRRGRPTLPKKRGRPEIKKRGRPTLPKRRGRPQIKKRGRPTVKTKKKSAIKRINKKIVKRKIVRKKTVRKPIRRKNIKSVKKARRK